MSRNTHTALALALLSLAAAPLFAQPSFSLAWSEYPSWSAFGVADEYKIIDGDKGKLGPVEKKWNVDIELKQADYEPCLVMYGAGQCDAVCITNMDVLNPSLSVPSVAILPTSTSYGADACIVGPDITDVKQLKGKKVYGLAQTVSEYCFVRNLQKLGENPDDYEFANMDPGAAAVAMQQKQDGFDAIVVWNPFVLETLHRRKDTRVLFDSTAIPGEIVDMVVISQAPRLEQRAQGSGLHRQTLALDRQHAPPPDSTAATNKRPARPCATCNKRPGWVHTAPPAASQGRRRPGHNRQARGRRTGM